MMFQVASFTNEPAGPTKFSCHTTLYPLYAGTASAATDLTARARASNFENMMNTYLRRERRMYSAYNPSQTSKGAAAR